MRRKTFHLVIAQGDRLAVRVVPKDSDWLQWPGYGEVRVARRLFPSLPPKSGGRGDCPGR